MSARRPSGEKQRVHHHYLKGSVFCGECGSRLSIMNAKNRWGTVYPYFFCLGRQEKRTSCTQRVVLIDQVEAAVARCYATVQLTSEQRQQVERFILDELAVKRADAATDRQLNERRIRRLTDERAKLLEAHYADAIPLDLLKSEQNRISRELDQAERLLAASDLRYETVEARLEAALDLTQDFQAAYQLADAKVRRRYNQAFFTKIYVDDDYQVRIELAPPFGLLLHDDVRGAASQHATDGETGTTYCRRASTIPGREYTKNNTPAFAGVGSRNDWLVVERAHTVMSDRIPQVPPHECTPPSGPPQAPSGRTSDEHPYQRWLLRSRGQMRRVS